MLFVAAEAAPFAKVGGLADVIGALPKALRKLGVDARVLIPAYALVTSDPRWAVTQATDPFQVRMNDHWSEPSGLLETEVDGLPVCLLQSDRFFADCSSSQSLYGPGFERHLFLSAGTLAAMEQLDWIPDVIHCHDFHTGFLPVLLKEKAGPVWSKTASIFTIHNLAYQGEWGTEVLDALGLSHDLFTPDKLETWGRVNFLKAGCAFADRVNTVSPNYAREIQSPEYGCALEGLMRYLNDQGRLSGILNGIDTTVFDAATDPHIPATYWPDHLEGKATCRTKLIEECGFTADNQTPVVGLIGRLSHQKGLDLVLSRIEELVKLPIQLVVLGSGDPVLADALRLAEYDFPGNVRFFDRFDEALAQRIYAGSDLFLMPSNFEPCGLGQLIALRYGTLPIVRATGGLRDTVFNDVNGFVFYDRSPDALVGAVERAVNTWRDQEARLAMVGRAMAGDYGWTESARKYVDLYGAALDGLQPAVELGRP
ncbi:MAG: glycogen synthase [Fimbriimonas sp.]